MTDTDRFQPDDLPALLSALADGTLSDAQWDRLRSRLLEDPAARDLYRRQVSIHAMLETELAWPLEASPQLMARHGVTRDEDEAIEPEAAPPSLNDAMVLPAIHDSDLGVDEGSASLPSPPVVASVTRPSAWQRYRVGLAAAMVLTAVGFAAVLILKSAPPREQIANPRPAVLPSPAVATLVEADQTVWADQQAPAAGGRVHPGPWHLTSGVVRIRFDGGADVMIKSPARFELVSPSLLRLDEGVVSANVPPPAVGFTILTPSARLVDLGTEFGVVASATGASELHVLKGAVKLRPAGETDAAPQSTSDVITAGSARSIDLTATVAEIPLNAQAFEFAARGDSQSPYSRWVAFGKAIRQDPALLAYFTFERIPSDSGILRNTAGSEVGPGRVQGPGWVAGRYPGKSALLFSQPGDHVQVEIPGHLKNLTLWAWVRLDAVQHEYTSLLSSDVWGSSFAMHWNLMKNRGLEIGARRADVSIWRWIGPEGHVPPPDPQWHLLAATHQAGRGVRFFVDGNPAEPQPQADDVGGFIIGKAQIGGWSGGDRHFSGTIDELGVLGRVMTDDEIRKLYQSTKP